MASNMLPFTCVGEQLRLPLLRPAQLFISHTRLTSEAKVNSNYGVLGFWGFGVISKAPINFRKPKSILINLFEGIREQKRASKTQGKRFLTYEITLLFWSDGYLNNIENVVETKQRVVDNILAHNVVNNIIQCYWKWRKYKLNFCVFKWCLSATNSRLFTFWIKCHIC